MKNLKIAPKTGTFLIVLSNLLNANFAAAQSSIEAYDLPAVETSARPIKLLLNIGPSFSNLASDQNLGDEFSRSTGAFASAEVLIPTSERFAIRTGLNYIERGVSFEQNDADFGLSAKGSINLNYLTIPVLAELALINNNQSNFSLFIGPYAAFATSRNVSSEVKFQGTTQSGTDPLDDSVKNFDFGGRIGAAYDTAMGDTLSARFQAFYDRGFNDLSKDSSDEKAFNQSFIASVGLGIKL